MRHCWSQEASPVVVDISRTLGRLLRVPAVLGRLDPVDCEATGAAAGGVSSVL